jgi:hypothetical protein
MLPDVLADGRKDHRVEQQGQVPKSFNGSPEAVTSCERGPLLHRSPTKMRLSLPYTNLTASNTWNSSTRQPCTSPTTTSLPGARSCCLITLCMTGGSGFPASRNQQILLFDELCFGAHAAYASSACCRSQSAG